MLEAVAAGRQELLEPVALEVVAMGLILQPVVVVEPLILAVAGALLALLQVLAAQAVPASLSSNTTLLLKPYSPSSHRLVGLAPRVCLAWTTLWLRVVAVVATTVVVARERVVFERGLGYLLLRELRTQ